MLPYFLIVLELLTGLNFKTEFSTRLYFISLYNPDMRQLMPTMRRFLSTTPQFSFMDPNNYTNELKTVSRVPKQLIYRVIDLEGNLVSDGKSVAGIDKGLLNRIYEKMIYTEEMDTILLKAKGQGSQSPLLRQNILLYDFVRRGRLHSSCWGCSRGQGLYLSSVQRTGHFPVERIHH